jgi:hypothetical protein
MTPPIGGTAGKTSRNAAMYAAASSTHLSLVWDRTSLIAPTAVWMSRSARETSIFESSITNALSTSTMAARSVAISSVRSWAFSRPHKATPIIIATITQKLGFRAMFLIACPGERSAPLSSANTPRPRSDWNSAIDGGLTPAARSIPPFLNPHSFRRPALALQATEPLSQ